jgi:hypothetical protein
MKGDDQTTNMAAAAAPSTSAAVGTAANAPAAAFRGTVAGTNVVVGDIPEVNGASATAEAPAKAGDCVVAEGLGVAVVLDGFSTLYYHHVVSCLREHTEPRGVHTCQ